MQKPLNSFRGQNLLKINSFLPWLVSSLEYFPHSNFQKRIVSAETIRGNTVAFLQIAPKSQDVTKFMSH